VVRSTGRIEQWKIQQKAIAAFLRVYGGEVPQNQRAVLQAFLDCGTAHSGWTRVQMMLSHGFLRRGLARNLAMMWELLRMPPP
jgi:hypothetical protein